MYGTGHRKAIFKLVILYAVSPHQQRSSLEYLIHAAAEDVFQDRDIHRLHWKADHVHRRQGLTAHSVDVTQGVGYRNLTEGVGVIDNRREEVHGLDDGQFLAYLVDPGIIRTG